MGNGFYNDIRDLIYIKTQRYKPDQNKIIAAELDEINSKLQLEQRNYVLVGPGRWGSSDPWLGIPVKWTNISSVKLLVELGLEDFNVDPSQGTHFFHNITSFEVGYFTITPHLGDGYFNRDYLDSIPAHAETKHIRHLCFLNPLHIDIDGRKTKGVIWREP